MKTLGIYIHVPFCIKKCPYCDFYSVRFDDVLSQKYVKKVCEEIKNFSADAYGNYRVDTIYFGGGTPSLLSCSQISEIFNTIIKNFKTNLSEVTIEVNPNLANVDKNFYFKELKSVGINRVSLGAQSFNDSELKMLKRSHTNFDTLNCVQSMRSAGISNISIDLIVGISHQTLREIENSIKFLKILEVPHVSTYLLEIKKGTEFFKNQANLFLPKDDEIVNLYKYVCLELKKIGYNHYEISNFAKKNFESKHNLKYWDYKDYVGFGPNAHSFINGRRFHYEPNLENFLSKPNKIFDDDENFLEVYIALQLRKSEGLTNKNFEKMFHTKIPKKYFTNALKLNAPNLLKINKNSSISLTEEGFLVSNLLIEKILWG